MLGDEAAEELERKREEGRKQVEESRREEERQQAEERKQDHQIIENLGLTGPPPSFPGEMSERSYDRHANTPKWVQMCEAKLEFQLKDRIWKKQNSQLSSAKSRFEEQIARIKAALDASRMGKRCEVPEL